MGTKLNDVQRARETWREHRRRRFLRRSRRAYIRSVYSLPSLATLGNAICGFAAMYVATLAANGSRSQDAITVFFAGRPFVAAAYLVFLAMLFDALDGRLARFTRHTTDFGGQLDSMADVVSFGCAPAFLSLVLFKNTVPDAPVLLSRCIWGVGALYMSCAAIRLARFNVSNEHGEQHHQSFLGLPSPAAGAVVVAIILLQQEMVHQNWLLAAHIVTYCLPPIVLLAGLLMVSHIRYPHLVNRYLGGRRSPAMLVLSLAVILGVLLAHRYVLALGTVAYLLWGLLGSASLWRKPATVAPPTEAPPT
ncbi:MAG: CDP-diacylglycerol--serine O-phosphatidyltransferase [Tepidisphaeraceae bacterium]|jgi:CDP-diacylglycerol--serine O-phosphatidyltransferase